MYMTLCIYVCMRVCRLCKQGKTETRERQELGGYSVITGVLLYIKPKYTCTPYACNPCLPVFEQPVVIVAASTIASYQKSMRRRTGASRKIVDSRLIVL